MIDMTKTSNDIPAPLGPTRDSRSRSFNDQETECNYYFENARESLGGFWHFYTPGFQSEIINITNEDYKFSVSNMAISAAEAGITIVTDSVMENHIHGLFGCSKEKCFEFREAYVYRAKKYLRSIGRNVNFDNFKCNEPTSIDNLRTMRNEIAYINRNGYVVNNIYTPYSYPWSGGNLYFNPFAKALEGVPFEEIGYREKRRLTFRTESHFMGLKVRNGMVLHSSYINYKIGESMFANAHQYIDWMTKKVEAYRENAIRLGDQIVLTSDELYNAAEMLSNRDYNVKKPSQLPPQAKIEIAKKLHYDYNASIPRLQSILVLPIGILNELFPKTK